jgi:hypothetical protein
MSETFVMVANPIVPAEAKRRIMTAVLQQIPGADANVSISDQRIFQWWFTARQGGFRLTPAGDAAFQKAGIEFYICSTVVPKGTDVMSWASLTLAMSRKIKCPYYVDPNEKIVRLYDSKIAMLFTIYGDLYSYLDSVK